MSNNLSSYPRPLQFLNREVKEGPRLLKRLPDGVEEKPYTFFSIKPLTPIIGAEIEGLDLSKPLAKEVQEELNRAF
ncbi:hypothetical protein AAAC51_13920 [Priestia megaterium]|nr:TauD/TfdA family dioxygenase [Priestia sp. OVL9]